MKTAGIICEYNPFHNGHEYLIKKAKAEGNAVVAVMSGCYTQRGELAVADKYVRAETALRCGADMVLELPFPFCMSGAEFFAKGGLCVLEAVGADSIWFGSESGDIERLTSLAKTAQSEKFKTMLKSKEKSFGDAKQYFDMLCMACGDKEPISSNDILGIEYIKAAQKRKIDIEAHAVKRIGDGFLSNIAEDSRFASATAIRKYIEEGKWSELSSYMPKLSIELLSKESEQELSAVSLKRIEQAILSFWRLCDPSRLSDVAELGGGLEYRIHDAALSSCSLEELEAAVATKKYTSSRIRRAMLFAMLGVKMEMLDREPMYTELLGATEKGRAILSSLRRNDSSLKIITKSADAPNGWQKELTDKSEALYTLAFPKPQKSSYFTKKKICLC